MADICYRPSYPTALFHAIMTQPKLADTMQPSRNVTHCHANIDTALKIDFRCYFSKFEPCTRPHEAPLVIQSHLLTSKLSLTVNISKFEPSTRPRKAPLVMQSHILTRKSMLVKFEPCTPLGIQSHILTSKLSLTVKLGQQTLKWVCYQAYPDSAMCVRNFNDSRGFAIRITYRISLRSSLLWEPRHPLPKVVLCAAATYRAVHFKIRARLRNALFQAR